MIKFSFDQIVIKTIRQVPLFKFNLVINTQLHMQ